MAAFMLHGLTPGPLLIQQQPNMLYSIFIAIIVSSILMLVLGKYISREFAKILNLPYPLLAILIMVLGIVGAYSLRNNFTDILILFSFSFIGYFFDRFNYSSSAFVLGLILGRIAENSLRKQLIVDNGSWLGFITRPLSLIILIISLIAFFNPLIKDIFAKKKKKI